MPKRAAVTYKTPDELRTMSLEALDSYLSWLRDRASWLAGPAQKETRKRLEIAQKLRAAR